MTHDPAAQLAPVDLEHAQLTLAGRIDFCAFIRPQPLFTDVINPESRDGDDELEMIKAFGLRDFGRGQIKTAGFIITETLVDLHAFQVVFQGTSVGRHVYGDGA